MPPRPPHRPARAALLPLLLLLLAAPPRAAEALEVRTVLGVAGSFRRDVPVPVELRLRNDAGAPFSGVARVKPNDGPETSRRVHLPPEGEGRVVFPVVLSPATHNLRVIVEGAPGAEPFSEYVSVNQSGNVPEGTPLLVVLDRSGGRFPIPARASGIAVEGGAEILPDHPDGLSFVSAVLVGDLDPGALTDAQLASLRRHAESGGRLVLFPAGDLAALRHPLFAALFPGACAAPERAERVAFAAAIPPAPGDGSARAFPLPAGIARVALSELPTGAIPLGPDAVAVPLGRGHAIRLAFSPLERAAQGSPELMRHALALFSTPSRPFFSPLKNIGDTKLLPDTVKRAEPAPIFAFLFLYILLVGPGNYLFLAMRRRKDLLLYTIPGIALAAGAVMFLLVESSRDETNLTRQVDLVWHAGPGQAADAASVVSRFSSGGERFDAELPPGAAVCAYSPSSYSRTRYAEMLDGAVARHRDDGATFGPVAVERWSGAIFHVAAAVGAPGAPVLPDAPLSVAWREERVKQGELEKSVRVAGSVRGHVGATGAPPLAGWLLAGGERYPLSFDALEAPAGRLRVALDPSAGTGSLPDWAGNVAADVLKPLAEEAAALGPLLVVASSAAALPVSLSTGGRHEAVAFHVFALPPARADAPREELFTEGTDAE